MSRAARLWRSLRRAARVVWADQYGRIAVMVILIGVTGLVSHYWSALPLLVILPRFDRQHAR